MFRGSAIPNCPSGFWRARNSETSRWLRSAIAAIVLDNSTGSGSLGALDCSAIGTVR